MKYALAYTAAGLYFGKGVNDKSKYISQEVSAVLCSAAVKRNECDSWMSERSYRAPLSSFE